MPSYLLNIYPTLPYLYDFVVVMYFISFVMILLNEPSFRIHMRKTLRKMSWRGRRNQKENRKSRKLPRSRKLQKSRKRRALKGKKEIPASLEMNVQGTWVRSWLSGNNQEQSGSIRINQNQSAPISINQHQSASISINQQY